MDGTEKCSFLYTQEHGRRVHAVGNDEVFNLTNIGVISTVSMVQTYQLVTVNTFSTVPT